MALFAGVAATAAQADSSDPLAAQGATRLLGADAATLPRQPLVTPQSLGGDPLSGLQFADPTEGINTVKAPTGNSQGTAQLSVPLSIPPGRGGVQPDLTVGYDSSSSNSWLGVGWNLDPGSITVDTSFGVPRYDPNHETETYDLNGDQLSPTAITDHPVDRVGDRADFTRRVETQYDLIIRHGSDPSNYWWEVHDKAGDVFWYGGRPDLGGPDGARPPGSGLDENAVLRTGGAGTPIYRWALSAQRDVGVNMIRYNYETATAPVGDQPDMGKQLYLKSIFYTCASTVSLHKEDPAYEVKFLRDGDINPRPAQRKDVIVDANGGFIQTTADLLRRVEVWYGKPNADETPRTYDVLSRAFNFNYREGAFGKSLLTSVDQVGSDGNVFASNKFDYYSDVQRSDGSYNGYGNSQCWSSGVACGTSGGDYSQSLLSPVGLSALGASETTGATAHAYLGFSPEGPNKDASAGGSLTVSGDVTEAVAEMIDLNGDGLPDKVYRKGAGQVYFRLNQSGPNGGTSFGDEHTVDVGGLSSDIGVGVSGGPEAYLDDVLAAQFSVGANFTIGNAYFIDVNNDGLPDYVSNGKVLFDHLDSSGTPTFGGSSGDTKVPLGGGSGADLSKLQAGLQQLDNLQRQQSPLVDTVRRWVAPFSGTVSIDAPVTYDPPNPDPNQPASASTDGVRTTVQLGAAELWSAPLVNAGDSATPTFDPIQDHVVDEHSVAVSKGEAIYFRVQSVDNGNRDRVRWAPKITYTAFDQGGDTNATDVNGLSASTYDANADFTVAGRPGAEIAMPVTGTVRFDAVLKKTKPTTDDIEVLVLKDGHPIIDRKIAADTVAPDGIDVGGAFNVLASDSTLPGAPAPGEAEKVQVKIRVDSPIDMSAIHWSPRLYYTSATRDGATLPSTDPRTGQPSLELAVPSDTDLYPKNNLTSPATPWHSGGGGDNTVQARVTLANDAPDASDRMFLTVKQRGKLIAKAALTPDQALPGTWGVDLPASFDEGDYWFDISVRDDNTNLSEKISSSSVKVGGGDGVPVPYTLNWSGRQGIFPIAYRGWGYAGYNGDGNRATQPIDEGAFVLRKSDFPHSKPTGFDSGVNSGSSNTQSGYKDPAAGNAFPFTAYELPVKDASGVVTSSEPVWRGVKDDISGAAGSASSSRRGVDDPAAATEIISGSGAGAGAHGVPRLGITAPVLSLSGSVGPFSGSLSLSPSSGLLDEFDLNGDGFPDLVTPGQIEYTGPRGGYVSDPQASGAPSVVNQDLTLAAGVGFNGSAINIKADAKGKTNTAQESSLGGKARRNTGGAASESGSQATDDMYGANVGISANISAEYTNPGAAPGLSDYISKLGSSTGPSPEQTFSDVNGDGLPDEVSVATDGTVNVQLNEGYGFSSKIKWAGRGFEAEQQYSGGVGTPLGFSWEHKEIGAGLSLNQSIDLPSYSWIDVNGDGILDRLSKQINGPVTVAFGTGNGLLTDDQGNVREFDYGSLQTGSFGLTGDLPIPGIGGLPTGPQIAQSTTQGLGADADFTVPIWLGPECPLCFILINPGVSVDQSFSSSQIQLTDINGDGVPDSLQSTNDGTISVKLGQVGRTNLLRSVTNSLGGQIRLDYQRNGNTVDHPGSAWALSSVQNNDGRPGDGADTLLSTFAYSGARYSALERQDLGFSTVTERQRADQNDGNVYDDPVRRTIERSYLNSSVFDSGLQTSEKVLSPDGTPLKQTRSDWQLVDVADNHVIDSLPAANDPALFAISAAPQQTKLEQRWYDKNGAVGEDTWNTFQYDNLGNVIKQVDVGQPENSKDDLTAFTTYSNCTISESADYRSRGFPCPAPTPQGRISPLWSPNRCPTWTSVPAHFQIVDAAGKVLRERDGAPAVCDNTSVTDEKETQANGKIAETLLNYDAWGNYAHISYPTDSGGNRVHVDYVYDPINHTHVADVVESRNATATPDANSLHASATFDGITGRIASRSDANGQTTSYTYDPAGRLASITEPNEQGSGHATASFEYLPNAPGYAYAIAHNYDAFNPTNRIDTATFVDGTGRVTQTKQDATLFQGAGSQASDQMIVSGAIEWDALGRAVKQWYPTTEAVGSIGTFHAATAATNPTVTSWNLLDQTTGMQNPNGTSTSTDHAFGGQSDFGASLFLTTFSDENGKKDQTYTDARGNVVAREDRPSGAPAMRTSYAYDPLGELTSVTDPGSHATTNTYDLLGERTSTQTPDGGLVQYGYDTASNLISKVTPKLRAAHQQISYTYNADRPTGITYPDGTPNVSYQYGAATGGGINGAGRVVAIQDGARQQQLTYDRLGQVASDTSTMALHNLSTSTAQKVTYRTGFTYDSFGRVGMVTYPDGEVVTNGYDSGGLLNNVAGTKAGQSYGYVDRLEYDEFGDRRFLKTANGVQTLYGYYPLTRRLATQVADTPARRIQALNYSYDPVGNVTQADDQLPPPQPSLYGGPGSKSYRYDPYYRLTGSAGTYTFAPSKVRNFTYNTGYDVNGNVTSKRQTDVITQAGGSQITQAPTTYTENPIYSPTHPHQISTVGTRSYTYDADGNLTGWTDSATGQRRTVTWDASDHMTSVADQGSTTTYTYDNVGQLGITRGPSGEIAFVNPWYTVRNATERWKEIWAGNDRIATQKVFDDASFEAMRYFLHKDLQGSVNMVTDNNGLAFQHFEYFPAGEPWITEQSTAYRTPYHYTAAYLDDARNLTNMGARWYEPREQFLYAPDPLLQQDPSQTVDDPALLPAYSYGENDPERFVDLSGRSASSAQTLLKTAFGLMRRPNQPLMQPALQGALQTAVAAVSGAPVSQGSAGAGAPAGAPGAKLPALTGSAPATTAPEAGSLREKIKDLLGDPALVKIHLGRTDTGKLTIDKVAPLGIDQFNLVRPKKKATK
jgi:RHS repeat-associated protein